MAYEIRVAFIGAVAGVVGGMLPAVYNYEFIEKTKQSIEQRAVDAKITYDSAMSKIEAYKAETSVATEVRGLLQGIYSATKITDADSSALATALFGRNAILPLIQVIDGGSDVPMNAALKGLRATGAADLEGTCPILVGVLRNRTRLYKWTTHKHVIQLLATLDCPNAEHALNDYKWFLLQSTPERYSLSVVIQPPMSDKIQMLQDAVNQGLERLRAK